MPAIRAWPDNFAAMDRSYRWRGLLSCPSSGQEGEGNLSS